MGSTRLHDLPRGSVDAYDDNEVRIRSTMRDPPKLRLSVQADQVEANMGGVTFNVTRSDGRDEEYAYIMGQLTPDKQSGVVYIAVRGPGEQQARQKLYIGAEQIISHVPIFAPNLGAGGGKVTRFYSDHGRFCFNIQDDGGSPRIVVYDTKGSADESTWAAWGVLPIPRL